MGLDWTNGISFREYSIFCIKMISVDWPDMGLPIFPNPCFGPIEPGLCLGYYGGIRAWHRPHCSFGLASGILGMFLYPYQLPPSPCVWIAWARAVIIPAAVCYFHVSARIQIN